MQYRKLGRWGLRVSAVPTDYVDLYQCHRFDESVPVEETCRGMADLIGRGEVLYWGVSAWSADQIAHAVVIDNAGAGDLSLDSGVLERMDAILEPVVRAE